MISPNYVAIVEDEPLVASLLTHTLQTIWRPAPALRVYESLLEYADSLAVILPCLALVDLQLPDSAPENTLARLVDWPCVQVPSIVISGYLSRVTTMICRD